MVTANNLSPGSELPEPIIVQVQNVNWSPGKGRRAAVDLIDEAGNPLTLIDFNGANISVTWKPKHRYRISNCNIANQDNGDRIELAPSKRTRIESLGPIEELTRVLVIGDTHVGRKEHPKTGEEIDPTGAFISAVEWGMQQEVDSVIHVGDIFHESATSSEADRVDKGVFQPLGKEDIPFFYIRGNHSSEAGNNVLASHRNVRNLNLHGASVGSVIRIFGINHYEEGAIPWDAVKFPRSVIEPITILVLHQTLQQLSGSSPKSVDVNEFHQRFDGGFNLVLSGHHHDAMYEELDEGPVMYTGASERMSKNKDGTDRVAWLITTDKTTLWREKYEIPFH